MNKNNLKGSIILLLAAVIWGFAFVAQDQAAKYIQPFTVNALRSFIGAIILIPVAFITSKKKNTTLIPKTKSQRKKLILTGTVCGVMLCIAANFQQFGIAAYPVETAASARAGFITAMYIIFVPIFSIILKKRPSIMAFIAVAISVVGLYLLCFSGGIGGVYSGDLIMLVCAVAFTFHIMSVDTLGAKLDGVKISCIQFFVCAILSSIFMFVFEQPTIENILKAALPLLYIGVMSSGVAYTLQIIGQQKCSNPTIASITMSFESVFAAIGGAIFGQKPGTREILGCVVMFAAIIISQLKTPKITFKKATP